MTEALGITTGTTPKSQGYETGVKEVNPRYITITEDGSILTPEESEFIYYYIITRSPAKAFIQAGLQYPEKPLTQAQRQKLLEEGRTDIIKEYNSENIGGLDDEEYYQYKLKQYRSLKKKYKRLSVEEQNRTIARHAFTLLSRPSVSAEVHARLARVDSALIADSNEVLRYLTAVMRGQVLDQFGLEAPLQERTRAAESLAKRLIDIPKKCELTGQNGETIQLVIQEREENPPVDAEFEEK